ncbi:MAG: hypothetical protein J5816_01025 [Clostridia bacterium]|nr:hypothetical protein [Clostridia bacterium]
MTEEQAKFNKLKEEYELNKLKKDYDVAKKIRSNATVLFAVGVVCSVVGSISLAVWGTTLPGDGMLILVLLALVVLGVGIAISSIVKNMLEGYAVMIDHSIRQTQASEKIAYSDNNIGVDDEYRTSVDDIKDGEIIESDCPNCGEELILKQSDLAKEYYICPNCNKKLKLKNKQ